MSDSTKEYAPEHVAIIDDDPTVLQAVSKAVREYGIPNVSTFKSGKTAWAAIQEQSFDAFIMDWKLPDMSGLALFNRIRESAKNRYSPVMVVSGFVNGKDFRLVEEMPMTLLVEKPFNHNFMLRKFSGLLKEYQWFSDEKEKIEALVNELKAGSDGVLATIHELIDNAPKPTPMLVATARILVSREKFAEAESILKGILKNDAGCVLALHELGKLYLRQRRFKDATQTLQAAEKQSPENLERLCMLGNAGLNLLDTTSANSYFKKALDIDHENEVATAGKNVASNMDQYLARFDVTSIPTSFAGLMNAIGISMVRTGCYDKGIEHYQSAMHYVEGLETKAKLSFNLGLGYLRWKKPDDARGWFEKALEQSGGQNEKARSYIEKLGGGPKESTSVFDMENESLWEDLHQNNTYAGSPPAPPSVHIVASASDAASSGLWESEDESVAKTETPSASVAERDVFADIVKACVNLRFSDPGLLGALGLGNLRKVFEAYAATINNEKVCIVIPNIMTPVEVARLKAPDAEAKGVVVFRQQAGQWVRMWPELNPVNTAV